MRRFPRIALTIIVCTLVIEFAYRALSGASVFTLANWRDQRVSEADLKGLVQYDPVLGWTVLGGVRSNWINTLANGFRANGDPNAEVRPGGVLVVGNSFAAGAQVNDDESWPAHLEGILGQPVYNAAIGGYGVDQMVLRAEQFVPSVKPKTVVAAIQFDMVLVNQYRTYNAPKPYFVVENGQLVRKNNPVPPKEKPASAKGLVVETAKDLLGRSYVADRIAMKVAPTWWLLDDTKGQFIKVDNDPVDISCRLLARLKERLDLDGIRLLVVIQENGQILTTMPGTHPYIAGVPPCARAQGIEVVNTRDRLRPIAERSREEFEKLFVMGEGKDAFGHMSSAGNRLIAEIVAEALHAPAGPRARLGTATAQ